MEALCQTSVQIVIGNPPTLTLIAPIDGGVHTLGEDVSFDAVVSDPENTPLDISMSWLSDIDGVFSTQGADTNGNMLRQPKASFARSQIKRLLTPRALRT